VVGALFPFVGTAEQVPNALPVHVGQFEQQVQTTFTEAEGLPSANVLQVAREPNGDIVAETDKGPARFADGRWSALQDEDDVIKAPTWYSTLVPLVASIESLRAVAEHDGEIAVAAKEGLFLGDGTAWRMALPQQGDVRWAPVDVRAVAYDAEGHLWFACPQGVGYRVAENDWRLFTGAEGLPFNDFTCMAAGPKGVWFGTTNGAIRYADGDFEFRQGRRWLLDNHVRGIAISDNGDAWLATAKGVSRIEFRPMTLAQKAAYFEEEIDKYHRRTELGYVNAATMSTPGDKSTAVAEASDNDGHFMGLYLSAVSLGYAATKNPKLKADAEQALKALSFLSEVTEGGTHPAPRGFIARAVEPVGGPDPNLVNSAEWNKMRRERDALWKQILPRWPIDETGKWYWKCDSSSDELDGYYLAYGIYYDRVCETEEEKAPVREIVRSITDHLIDHDYNMVDHDGKPTRWGHFSPADLNRNEAWWFERGINSGSILTFLLVAHHITGDQKYRDAYMNLAVDHGYAMNVMTSAKFNSGPGSYGQADDNMSFMNFYHLLRYETDPRLLGMYQNAVFYYWRTEKYERNPFLNFVAAAGCLGKTRTDHWGSMDMSPDKMWIEDSVDTLKRYPLDLIDWSLSNAHRIDMVPLGDHVRDAGGAHLGKGHRVDGKVYRIDENHAIYWGDDPWELNNPTDGTRLREGVSFMIAYYMGLVHGYIAE
jgi:hypothetical protein